MRQLLPRLKTLEYRFTSQDPEERSRLRRFMVFYSVVMVLISFTVIALFLNHIEITEANNLPPTRRIQDLVNLLNQAETKREDLEKELLKLRQRLTDVQNPDQSLDGLEETVHLAPNSLSNIAKEPEYRRLLNLAGLTQQKGAGIIVTLQESGTTSRSSEATRQGAPTQNRLQSDDLLKMLNELKAAGASSLAVNQQRIIATTSVVNSGSSLMVNQTRISSPIEIKALGKPETLRASLQIRGGILEYLEFFGIHAKIRIEKQLLIPAYSGVEEGARFINE